MTTPVTPSAVDGLDLAGVLAEHEDRGGGWHCSCQPDGSLDVLPTTWESHLADALATEVRRFLDDSAVQARVAKAIHAEVWHVMDHGRVECDDPSGCGATKDDAALATAALAALTDTQGGSREG